MNEIKIVKYDHSYAAPLAEMWNKSGQNWGGDEVVRTAEDVKNENEKMGNICAFLALDGEEVVGYCSFSMYKQDEGASYIPLLNVRPDYIGKKIGKSLVLECVKMAMEVKWPRLDLYTWQGNDKAVPLYKKCGFFWERRDDSTHLMNFIPYVMRTEAVKEYFNTIDWYKDSIREIKIECDGRNEEDFDYFDYIWKKDDLSLQMEFERKGRGLSCIETNDYLIKARVSKQDLVVGRTYQVTYECVNKSGKPLNITIKGMDDKNIKYSLEYTGKIIDSQVINGEFFLDTIQEEQNKWKTHPCVTSIMTINGKEALFKVGVNPKFPITMNIANQNEVKYLDQEVTCYLDIENSFDEDINIECILSDDERVTFKSPLITCSLEAKEKKSLPIACVLSDYGFYNKEIEVMIKTSKEELKHNAKVRGAFRGYTGKFHGENEKDYHIYHGQYMVSFSKRENSIFFSKLEQHGENGIYMKPPQIGKPYSLELFNKRPDSVSFIAKEKSEMIKAEFTLEEFQSIKLTYYVELFQDGLVNIYSEVKNQSENHTYKELYATQEMFYLLYDAYIPYDGKVIRTPGADGLLLNRWDPDRLSENWLFSEQPIPRGIGWHPSTKVTFNHVFVNIESKIDNLTPGDSFNTEPIVLTIDTFDSWEQFRRNMGNTKRISRGDITQSFECKINDQNPFIEDTFDVTFEEIKKIPLEGTATITSRNNLFEPITENLQFEDNKATVSASYNEKPELDIMEIGVDIKLKKVIRQRAVFFKGTDEVRTNRYKDQGKEVYELNNGCIRIKASPEFSAGIYSLNYKGMEWLDHSFPNPSIKGWWNYWTGGLHLTSGRLTYASLFKEEKKAEFVSIEDNVGNTWSGIKTTFNIQENEEFKGIRVDQYFLLLPNVPVLCDFSVIHQNTCKYMHAHPFRQLTYIKEGENLSDNWVIHHEDRGEKTLYRCGDAEFDMYANRYLIHGSDNTDVKMIRLTNEDCTNDFFNTNGVAFSEYTKHVSLADGKSIHVNPSFIVFSKDELDDMMLEDLSKVTFK